MKISAFWSGFFTSLSLILAIGAQNAFVLKQGIKKEHVFAVCLICALGDALLIFAGVIQKFELVKQVAIYGGFIFLFVYSLKSLYSAFKNPKSLLPSVQHESKFSKIVLLTLAFTWLNPHVYLDTMLLIGSISTKFGNENIIFGIGASLASLFFFFSLGYGARVLAPVFAKEISWKILEIFVGIIMLIIAFSLLFTKV
ncbi:LysE/ArgO family amino acid transporter [Campylobacter concisus]|uniref:LysE/ArgO family amino acid transporter n=1 Tax=Campylobacter concisus TaxID=199 RepID=UPI0015E1A0AF|nr:LysE/ArgO family amino acid transporter [Campylobacter concisus]